MFRKILKQIIPRKLLNLRHFFWSWWGSVKCHHPSEELLVIGVTGTSGKTSTIHFLRQILESAGFKVGSLSTADFYVDGKLKLNDQKMTMLGRMQIQKYLREMVDKKCEIAIVETTSEGFLQYRHSFINYDMIMLTNLYPEHIEAHGGFENYKAAKLGIFEYVSKCNVNKELRIMNYESGKVAIVNGKSEYVEEFLNFNFSKKIKFKVDDIQISKEGLNFIVDNEKYFAPLYGEHNAENLAAVIETVQSLGVDKEKIKTAIANLKSPPGRLEFISEAEKFGFQVIVDYAFEPVALAKLYEVVELLMEKTVRPTTLGLSSGRRQGKIIHVCGSTGGGRDKARREPIGKMVGEKANIVIVTNEDPYDEDPIEIIKQVSAGAQKVGKILDKDLFEVLNRGEAIKKAIDIAQSDDLVLITGKGSEQKMCVANGKMVDWDDREEVRKCLGLEK